MALIPSQEELDRNIRDFISRVPRPIPLSDSARPGVTDHRSSSESIEIASPPSSVSPSASPVPAGTFGGHYSFQGKNASDGVTPKVLIFDGLVGTPADQEVPSGMGADDYTITVADGNEVYVGITYDTDTLEITSRFLDVGSTPDDSFGAAYFKIIDIAVTFDGDGNATVYPVNSHCGDIIFTFDFGGLNGQPAIKLTPAYGDWISIAP